MTVQEAVEAVRAGEWEGTPVTVRLEKIRALRKIVSRMSIRIAETISDECRRPVAESISQEVLPVLEMLRYLERHYPRWLLTRERYLRPGFSRKRNYLLREPIGIMGLITPGNFPFSLALMSLGYLLIPGNTVLLKPSESSRDVAQLISAVLEEAGIIPHAACVVAGGADVGSQLIEHPEVKKVFFIGSRQTGASVADVCSRLGKPCVLEMGGGTTAAVLEDANLKLASAGIAWSALYADGRSCISTDRVFVHETVADRFLELLAADVRGFHARPPSFPKIEAERVKSLIDDAVAHGSGIVCGGRVTETAPDAYEIEPTLLTGLTPSMRIYREEVFAPLLVVQRTPRPELAVALSSSLQPLAASIWTRHRRIALDVARSLNVGMVWVNDASYGLPSLPWFGRGEAGNGSLFASASLNEVTRLKWISCHPSICARRRLWWNPYSALKRKLFEIACRSY